jgi:hypothetical protein
MLTDLIHNGSFNTSKFKTSVQKSFVSTGCYWYVNENSERKFKEYDGRTTFHGTLPGATKNCDDWQWQNIINAAVETYDEFADEDDSDTEETDM